jgi:hypothetical protein
MCPLLVDASSKAECDHPRRVLHIEYAESPDGIRVRASSCLNRIATGARPETVRAHRGQSARLTQRCRHSQRPSRNCDVMRSESGAVKASRQSTNITSAPATDRRESRAQCVVGAQRRALYGAARARTIWRVMAARCGGNGQHRSSWKQELSIGARIVTAGRRVLVRRFRSRRQRQSTPPAVA